MQYWIEIKVDIELMMNHLGEGSREAALIRLNAILNSAKQASQHAP